MTNWYKLLILAILFSTVAFAQKYTISGVVESRTSGEKLFRANLVLKGTTQGTTTDENGRYSLDVSAGNYTLMCSYIGYQKVEKEITVDKNITVNFSLLDYQFTLNVEVIADRAKERETPVAFTDLDKRQIEERLGSRDIPLVLNTIPSVYATDNGGGAGDSRINIRGFNQRNIAIMINGVPINDMENGWVYWSNWDGVGDATSSIQVQRGLTAINLATPSIGGTMNIITDPTKQKAGFLYKNEIGSGSFSKNTFFLNSGMIGEKFALTIGGVRKVGDGVVDKTWTEAWAYYLGASYRINDKNVLELYANGAPQRHGQRTYRLNIAEFSHEYAKMVGYSQEALNDPRLAEQGILYNSNWNSVSPEYNGKQYWNTMRDARYSPNFIMERENYYHKPVVNLNWYSQLADKMSLYTTVYYSGGTGGGSGTFGSLVYNYSLLQRVPDWGATIARNEANLDTLDDGRVIKLSRGILRNSVNNQWTVGAIAKTYIKFSKNFTSSFGLDWRTAEIDHYREVRDLLGGDFYMFTDNEFDSPANYYKGLGNKIDYNFTNTVNWYGLYGQGEYVEDKYTAYATAAVSMIKYDHTNHFKKDGSGSELKLESDNITGYQFKGGLSYRATENIDIYGNAGYVSKVPLFDAVINDATSELIPNPKNENFLSFEGGVNLSLLDRIWTISGNYYYTIWKERTVTKNDYQLEGSEGLVVVTGLNSLHSGIELSTAFQPLRYARLDAAFSLGNWKTTNNPHADYKNYSSGGVQDSTFTVYLDGIKVGDSPQTQFAAGFSVFPIPDMQLQLVWRYYANYYADWDPLTRTDANDNAQSWKTLSYNLLDLHFSYRIPVNIDRLELSIFAHVFNLTNTLYVQDATDNSAYNAWTVDGKNHKADDAEVFMGLPRTFNLGFTVRL